MTTRYIFGLLMLFTTAAIWGVGFVFQREGMELIGPFTFNAARFIIGALSVFPVILLFPGKTATDGEAKATLVGGILAGAVLFGHVTV